VRTTIGRPPRAGIRSTSRVEFLVTPAEFAALARVAKDSRQPVASVIREAVNSFVADYSDIQVFRLTSGNK
jgi:hypothetical protein